MQPMKQQLVTENAFVGRMDYGETFTGGFKYSKLKVLSFRYLFFIWNKNVKDVVKRTLKHKTIVGSECINWFARSGHDSLAIFDDLVRKGVSGFYRGMTNQNRKKKFVLRLAGTLMETRMVNFFTFEIISNLNFRKRERKGFGAS